LETAGFLTVTESRKPNIDANTSVQHDQDALDDVPAPIAVRTQWDSSRPSSRPPTPTHTATPSRRPPMIIDVPRINVEADESDAATTIFDPLEEGDLEALKRKLQGDVTADDDANQTLELRQLRGVKLEELEGLLRAAAASDDANTTIQVSPIDDKQLDELEESLTIEKRNRGLRKMSAPVLDPDGSGGWRAKPLATSTGLRDVDAEMFLALGKDLRAAWSAVFGFARRVARSIAALFSRLFSRLFPRSGRPARSEPRRLMHPDDTVPPVSRRTRRLARLRRR
jgi:hypothetical protein